MYNTLQYNGNIYNAIIASNTEVIEGIITYNSYVLHKRDDVYISQADYYNAPNTEVETFRNPERNGIGVLDYKQRKRILKLSGTIKKDTADELREEIDEMKKFLYQPNKTLQVIFDGDPRQTEAYVEDLQFDQKSYTTNFIKFNVSFAVISPYWKRVGTIDNTFSSITDTFQENEINTGSTITYPKFLLTFNSASSVTSISLEMGDAKVEISESMSANDIVIIDSIEQTVTINYEEVDFDGVLPIMEVGNNPYTLTVDGTYSITLSVQYNLRFI